MPSKLWQIAQSDSQGSVQVKAGEWRPEDPQCNGRTGVLIDPCQKSRYLVGGIGGGVLHRHQCEFWVGVSKRRYQQCWAVMKVNRGCSRCEGSRSEKSGSIISQEN